MKCPKCESNWFNGKKCSHCGFVLSSPVLKGFKIVSCSNCSDPIKIPIFYGEELRGRKKEKNICMRCQEIIDDKNQKWDYRYTEDDYFKNTNMRVFNPIPICVWSPGP